MTVTHQRTTYTEGRHHRDVKGRFASKALAGTSLAAMSGATVAGLTAVGAHTLKDAFPDARAARNKYGALAAGGAVLAGGAMAGHAHVNRNIGEVEKFLDGPKKAAKQRLERLRVSPDQARNASVLGQIGAGAGVVGGSALGAGIGMTTKHPGQGAGIGAALGGALGGAGGAAAGLAAGERPKRKRKPKLVGSAPTTVAKANSKKKDAAIGAAVGVGAGQVIGAGAHTASRRLGSQLNAPTPVKNHTTGVTSLRPASRAEYNVRLGNARSLARTADFHQGAKGIAVMAAGGAAAGLIAHKRKQNKALAPVAKMDDDRKTQLARAGIMGAQVADIAAVKSAYHETMNAKKEGTGFKASLNYGAKKAALPVVAGGLVATVAAERVMHSQQKKLRAANTASLKPKKAKVVQP